MSRQLMTLLCAVLAAGTAQAGNLAANPGFEDPTEDGSPAGWILFTTRDQMVSVTDVCARGGSRSLLLRAQGIPHEFEGAFQTLPITGGESYSFTAHVRGSHEGELGGTARGVLLIEWKDADGTEIGRIESAPWTTGLSRLQWEAVGIENAEAPVHASQANFCVHLGEGAGGATGGFLMDDVTVSLSRSPSVKRIGPR